MLSARDMAIPNAAFPPAGLREVLRSKHRLRIVWDLRPGPKRFGELRRRLSLGGVDAKAVASRMLSRELKSLAHLGLIHRRAYNVIPPKAEYRLTALGLGHHTGKQ